MCPGRLREDCVTRDQEDLMGVAEAVKTRTWE